MVKHYRDGTLMHVRTGIAALLGALTISLLSPQYVGAVSVDPLLDRVLSTARLGDQGSAPSEPNANSSKPTNNSTKALPASSKGADSGEPPALNSNKESAPIVNAPPMDPLPIIDTIEPVLLSVSPRKSVATSVASPAELGDSTDSYATPLQATSRGWELFGVMWYWWLGAAAILYYLPRRIARYRYHQDVFDNTIG